MSGERYGSKTDVVVKLILVFFISLLSFSVGTFVGKKFSDNQHKISQLEIQDKGNESAGENDRDVASVQTSSETKPADALNDEEIKKLAEEFVTEDEGKKPAHEGTAEAAHEATAEKKVEAKTEATPQAAAATTGTKEVVVTAPSTTTKTAVTKPSEAATRAVAGQTPEQETTKGSVKNRIPQSLPQEIAASAIGKYTVQVASYPTETEAKKLSEDLKGKGFNAFYVDAKVKTQTWYRVSVGLFATQKEADSYKADLLARAKVSSAIVQKVTN